MFTDKQLENFVGKVFGEYYYTGNNINVVCPICLSLKGSSLYSKKKLAILHDKKTNEILVKCWVCGYKARNLKKLVKKYKPSMYKQYIDVFFVDNKKSKINSLSNDSLLMDFNIDLDEQAKHHHLHKDDEDNIDSEPVRLPEGFVRLGWHHSSSSYYESHISYLRGRRIDSDEDLWYWNLGYVPWTNKEYRNRIIMPSYDSIGLLNYWTGRSIEKKPFQKYKNPRIDRENIIFNEIRIDWDKPLLVVEGPFDLIKTRKATSNSTCLLGSELTSNYLLFDKILFNKTPVILCLDPDARKKQYVIAERLNEFGNNVKMIDLNKETIEDVGSLTHDQFTEIFMSDSVIEYDQDYILRMKINSLQE